MDVWVCVGERSHVCGYVNVANVCKNIVVCKTYVHGCVYLECIWGEEVEVSMC